MFHKRESEVDVIVAAIDKTGLDYVKLVLNYLKIYGASDKIIKDSESKLNVKEWETLMEDCGY